MNSPQWMVTAPIVRVNLLRRGSPMDIGVRVKLRMVSDVTGSYIHWNGRSYKVANEFDNPSISAEYSHIKGSLHLACYNYLEPANELQS